MISVKVNKADPTDLYEQVAAEIRRRHRRRRSKAGERLAPAKDLAAVLGVNTNTVLRSLRVLAAQRKGVRRGRSRGGSHRASSLDHPASMPRSGSPCRRTPHPRAEARSRAAWPTPRRLVAVILAAARRGSWQPEQVGHGRHLHPRSRGRDRARLRRSSRGSRERRGVPPSVPTSAAGRPRLAGSFDSSGGHSPSQPCGTA